MPFLTGAGTRITRNATSVLARKRRKMCQDFCVFRTIQAKQSPQLRAKKVENARLRKKL